MAHESSPVVVGQAAEPPEVSPATARDTAPSLSKACVACHNRKLRCDASVAGIPCSRCVEKGCAEACARVERKHRRRNTARAHPACNEKNRPSVPNSVVSRHGSIETVATGAAAVGAGFHQNLFQIHTPASSELRPEDVSVPDSSEGAATELQICRAMMTDHPNSRSTEAFVPVTAVSRELVQYHHSQHYLTIIGEALTKQSKRRRMTRVVLDGIGGMRSRAAQSPTIGPDGRPDPLAGLDEIDREYLLKKQVLNLPPRECVESIFKCYFEFVYPYAPVLSKVGFVREYYDGCYSIFLVQAVLSSGSLYAPMTVLAACGFQSRSEAQAAFYSRAALLYDFECERQNLRMLQGSAILGSTPSTYEMDKEFRYWFCNAVRLAVKMGLHQSDLANEIDTASYRICQRIWWFLYSRDVLFSISGIQNMRLIAADSNTARPLTMEDFEPTEVPSEYAHILVPTSQAQRMCFVETGILATIGKAASCLSNLQGENGYHCLEDSSYPFSTWRISLLQRLAITPGPLTAQDVSLTVLLAQSYRLECIIFRMLRSWPLPCSTEKHQLAKQRLRNSMFELDTIIGRTMTSGILNLFPLSFVATIPPLLALHIELSLDESEPEVVRVLSRTYVNQNMILLRLMSDFPLIQRTIPVFEWVLRQKGLDLSVSETTLSATSSQHPSQMMAGGNTAGDAGRGSCLRTASPESDNHATESAQNADDWLEDMVGFDYLDNLYLSSFL